MLVQTPREIWMTTVLVVLPYLLSKVAIAANTAYCEYWFGKIGGAALQAEGDTLHWEFLLCGTAMGGMRAVSILTADAIRQHTVDDDNPSASGDVASELPSCWATIGARLFRGSLRRSPSAMGREVERDRTLGLIANAATVTVSLYGVVTWVLFWYAGQVFFIAKGTTVDQRNSIQAYGRGFAWGVLPTLWLYLNEQFALGLQASGVAFLYGGLVYATLATVFAGLLYPVHGAYGLGMGMSIGAWVAWIALKIHFLTDSRFRALQLNFEPLWLPHVTGEDRWAYLHELGHHVAAHMKLAIPLALSNMTGLARSLIVAAVVTASSTNDAYAYSISAAYFETLNIALLGASSSVSALISAVRFVEQVDQRNTDEENAAISGIQPSEQEPLLLQQHENTATVTQEGHDASRRRRLRRFCAAAAAVVFVVALLLGLLPLLFPETFAKLFGGKVYDYGDELVVLLLRRIQKFNGVNFASYTVGVAAMLISASLHGMYDVNVPLLINTLANAAGAAWTIGTSRSSPESSTPLYGGVVAQSVALVLMGSWWLLRYRRAVCA
jgi:hypothetical protein